MDMLNEKAEAASMRETAAAVALGLADLAMKVDDLQLLMGALVVRAGFPTDEATLEKAQSIDVVAQRLHHYAAVVAGFGGCLRKDCCLDLPHAVSSLTRRDATNQADPRAAGECELF